MIDDKAQKVKREYEYLRGIRQEVDVIRQEIADYVIPTREDLYYGGENQRSKRKGTHIYDGTAVSAMMLCADGLLGNMISPAMKWFLMKLPQKFKFLEKESEVRMWFQEYTEAIYSELNNSNFYAEMRILLRDGLSVCPGTIYAEEDFSKSRIYFKALHPKDGYFSENYCGAVDTMIRVEKLTARQAVQKFGIDSLSERIRYAYENHPNSIFEFLHSVIPRENYDTRKIDNLNKPYESLWIEKSGNRIVRESGFDLFPYVVWKYAESSQHPYGESPATFALPEIKRLNIISKGIAGAAALSVEPPYNVPAEMMGKVRLGQHGMNYYGSDFNRRVYRIDQPSSFPVALDREEKIRQMIKEFYNVDFFLMLAQSDRQRTALEVSEMVGERALILGPATSSLIRTIDSILDYVVYLGTRAGRIPPPPQMLQYYAGGQNIDTVYTGVLAQAQRRLFETQSITRSLELAAPIMQIAPESLDVINATESVRKILISNGYPEDAINSTDMITQIRQGRAQAHQAEIDKQDKERMANVVKALSQADKNTKGKISGAIGQMMGAGQGMPAQPGGMQ